MAHHLNWNLEKIFTAQGDLNHVLADWFERYEPLRKTYPLMNRIYPSLRSFDEADRKNGQRWQGLLARRLYSVYHLARRAAIRMHEAGGFNPFQTWRMLNCRPFGGLWTSAYSADSGKAAGKCCRSLFCPWCYLRRFEALRRLVKAPPTKKIRFPAGNLVSNPGVLANESKGLSVTLFTAYGEGQVANSLLFESNKVEPPNSNQQAALRRVLQDDVKRRCNHAIKHRLEDPDGQGTIISSSPEFLNAISTLSPIARETDDKVGIRFAYLHTAPFPIGRSKFHLVGDRKAISGIIELERIGGLSVEKALLLAQPHPWHLLDKPPVLQQEILAALRGRNTHAHHHPTRTWAQPDDERSEQLHAPDGFQIAARRRSVGPGKTISRQSVLG